MDIAQMLYLFFMLILAVIAIKITSKDKPTKKLTPKEEEKFEYDPEKGTYVKKNKE